MDPKIEVRSGKDLTFTLSAKGGVGVYTWMDHPAGTVGYFQDTSTGLPANGFYLIPGIDRACESLGPCVVLNVSVSDAFVVKFVPNPSLSKVADPNPADFVVRSAWNNTHL